LIVGVGRDLASGDRFTTGAADIRVIRNAIGSGAEQAIRAVLTVDATHIVLDIHYAVFLSEQVEA
jgi:hypothetical protein